MRQKVRKHKINWFTTDAQREAFEEMQKFDPTLREYRYPDFGFEDALNNGGKITNVWTLLSDHISSQPKYERLQNFINEEAKDKIEHVRRQINKIRE